MVRRFEFFLVAVKKCLPAAIVEQVILRVKPSLMSSAMKILRDDLAGENTSQNGRGVR